MFDQFLSAAMKQSNMRINAFDNLAIEFQDEAQNAMRRGVLRSKIYREIAAWSIGHSDLDCCKANSTRAREVPALTKYQRAGFTNVALCNVEALLAERRSAIRRTRSRTTNGLLSLQLASYGR
jgi:hypothetical protein